MGDRVDDVSSSVSRRSIIRGCSVAASGYLAGCSAIPLTSGSGGDGSDGPELGIRNDTGSLHEVSIVVLEKEGEPDLERLPRTLTAEPPTDPRSSLLQDQLQLASGDSKVYQDVFPEVEEPIEFNIFVELGNGIASAYAFADRRNSGLALVGVKITPDLEMRFGRIFE